MDVFSKRNTCAFNLCALILYLSFEFYLVEWFGVLGNKDLGDVQHCSQFGLLGRNNYVDLNMICDASFHNILCVKITTSLGFKIQEMCGKDWVGGEKSSWNK